MTAVEQRSRLQSFQRLLPRTPLLSGNDPEAKRAEIARLFRQAYLNRYEYPVSMCLSGGRGRLLPSRSLIPLRHPLIFYFGPHGHLLFQQAGTGQAAPQRSDARGWSRSCGSRRG